MSLTRLATLLLACTPLVARAVPVTLTTSGYLLDAKDEPLAATAQPLRFRLFSSESGGTADFDATCTTDVSAGYYSVVLGTSACGPDLDTAAFGPSLTAWLQVSVGTTDLLPRIAVRPIALATLAASARDAEKLGGVPATALVDANAQKILGTALPAAGGDLAGTLGSATVAKLQGRPVADLAPSPSQLLQWNGGAGEWRPSSLAASDVPDLDAGKLTSGTLPVARGGTGATSFAAASVIVSNPAGSALAAASCADGQVLRQTGSGWSCFTLSSVDSTSTQSIGGVKTFTDGLKLGTPAGCTPSDEGKLRTDLTAKRVEVCNGATWLTVKYFGPMCGDAANVKSVSSGGLITCSDDSTLAGASGMSLTNGGHCGSGTFNWRCEGVVYNQTGCANYASVCGITFTYEGKSYSTSTQCRTNSVGASPTYCTW